MRRTAGHARLSLLMALALVAAALSCRDEPAGPVPRLGIGRTAAVRTMTLASGDAQSGTVATALPAPFVVRLLNGGGQPVKGAVVLWSVDERGGSLSHATSLADDDGLASTTLTLDSLVGTSTVVAQLRDSPASVREPLRVTFTATRLPGKPARVIGQLGDAQTGTSGDPLPDPLSVLVTDRYGNAVQGAEVRWSAPLGSGTLAPEVGTTDATGHATAVWTLGDAGPNVATATVADAAPASFSATALPPVPAALDVVSGDAQWDTVTKTLAAPLTVRVSDGRGRPIAGVSVAWAVTRGGGAVSAPTSVTDAAGEASVQLTLGTVAEIDSVRATVGESLVARFGATSVAARLCGTSWTMSPATVAVHGSAILVSHPRDRFGNPVPRVESTPQLGDPAAGTIARLSDTTFQWTTGDWGGTYAATVTIYDCRQTPPPWGSFWVYQGQLSLQVNGPARISISVYPPPAQATVAAMLDVPAHVSSSGSPGGIRISWTVIAGGGSVLVGYNLYDFVTDPYGFAMIRWQLGTSPGINKLVGCAGDCDTVTVVTTPGPPVAVAKLGGDLQSAPAGTALSVPLSVALVDQFANPIPGAVVTWTPLLPTWGSTSPASSTAGASGAQTTWTLGPDVGMQQLNATASFGGVSRMTIFSATALPTGSSITLVSGGGQSGYFGAPLAQPIVVRVVNPAIGPVAGTPVYWTMTSGSGALSPAVSTTDANGFASTTWTLGWSFYGSTNPNRISVSANGATPISVEATGYFAPPASVAIVSGDAQTAQVMTTLPQPLVVRVLDAAGKPMNTSVAWSLPTAYGSATPTPSTTTSDGRASTQIPLRTLAGTFTITATAAGLPPVTFTATATPAPMCATTWSAAPPTAPGGGAVTLTAHLEDQYGNTIAGTGTMPQVVSGGGFIEPGTSWVWRLGSVVGTQTVRVSGYSCRRNDGSPWGTPMPTTTDITVTTTTP